MSITDTDRDRTQAMDLEMVNTTPQASAQVGRVAIRGKGGGVILVMSLLSCSLTGINEL